MSLLFFKKDDGDDDDDEGEGEGKYTREVFKRETFSLSIYCKISPHVDYSHFSSITITRG
jgi:hypothetical protein